MKLAGLVCSLWRPRTARRCSRAAGVAGAAEALEEIIVTARQREESIEDVPVSITAFTATEIKSAGIERPQDFIALTPGVSQVQTAEAGDMQVNIRGINTGRDAETNFALVVDGVLQTNPNALNQELAGVTQIEMLKGPQGALYGRNAVAGALIMTTRKPGDEWEIRGHARATASDNSYKGSIYVGGPIARGAARARSRRTRATPTASGRTSRTTATTASTTSRRPASPAGCCSTSAAATWISRRSTPKLDSGAINFNAAIALADAAAFLGAPAFYEDPNDHNFRYINNINPRERAGERQPLAQGRLGRRLRAR